MNFAEKLFDGLSQIGNVFVDGMTGLFNMLATPLAYLLSFLEGIFYFIFKLFDVAVQVIMLFVALFQFFFAIVAGFMRTISNWVGFTPSENFNFPSVSKTGFDTFISQIDPIGLYNIVPYLLLAFLWLGFAYKVIGMIGNRGEQA